MFQRNDQSNDKNDQTLEYFNGYMKPTRVHDRLGCFYITNRMFQRNDQSLEYFKGY